MYFICFFVLLFRQSFLNVLTLIKICSLFCPPFFFKTAPATSGAVSCMLVILQIINLKTK